MRKVRLIISGRVHGVGFRYSARREAQALGVNGYVRNLSGDRVEIVAEGEDDAVESLIAWSRSGPAWARVSAIQITELAYDNEFREFGVQI